MVRLFSEQNKLKFQEILKVIDWDLELGQRTTDEAMEIFYKEFQIAYNKAFPFVKLSRKRANDKPWISTALKNSIKQKDKLYQKFLLDQTSHNEMLYKAYKNKLKALIRKFEINCYQNIFSDRKNNIKDMWKHLGFLLNPNKNNSQNKKSVRKLNINGKTITEDKNIANAFNKYFANVGSILANKIIQDQPQKSYTKISLKSCYRYYFSLTNKHRRNLKRDIFLK